LSETRYGSHPPFSFSRERQGCQDILVGELRKVAEEFGLDTAAGQVVLGPLPSDKAAGPLARPVPFPERGRFKTIEALSEQGNRTLSVAIPASSTSSRLSFPR
jgi:hypothetical protein